MHALRIMVLVFVAGGTAALGQEFTATDGTRVGPTNATTNDRLGTGTAVSGDFALLGAPGKRNAAMLATGAAYVAKRSGSSWSVTQELMPQDGTGSDQFGQAVAVEGSWAAVGAPGWNSAAGSVYVYRFNGSSWVLHQKLSSTASVAGDNFGMSVGLSGSTLVVGAYGRQTYTGAAYVYRLVSSTWTLAQTLTASDGATYDFYGYAADVSGNVMIVGAYGDDVVGTNSGSAYVYRYNGSSWVYSQKLQPSDPAGGDLFASACAMDGAYAVLGSHMDDDRGTSSGSVYVFRDTGSSWVQMAKLTASDGQQYNYFGKSADISGNALVVGAQGWSNALDGIGNCGKAYHFWFDGASWKEKLGLLPPDPFGWFDDHFGSGVGVDGGSVVVGAMDEDAPAMNGGRAYLFEVTQGSTPGCIVAADCDDGNACTSEVCNVGTCSNPARASGTACGSSSSTDCDAPDTCDGAGNCVNRLDPAGTVCRAAAGECDAAETCTGSSATCPANTMKTSGTPCTADTNSCTNDICSGTSAICTHPYKPVGSACGSSSQTACDNPDTCNGSGVCLVNYAPATTVCRVAADLCDAAEYCTGNSATCPSNVLKAAGTVCRSSAGPCDKVETCSGTSATCPADALQPAGTVCRAAQGDCDRQDTCTGALSTCPDLKQPSGTACTDDGNACTSDVCTITGNCAHPNKVDGTACNDGDACTTGDDCLSGVCGGVPQAQCCGDGYCDPGEDGCDCPQDCTTELDCNDGLDNDCDGYADCRDADCDTAPECGCSQRGESCTRSDECCPGLGCKGKPGAKTCK